MSKVIDVIAFILLIPVNLFYLLIHACESLAMRSKVLKDKLFMKRFGLIDTDHVDAFLEWNMHYKQKRTPHKCVPWRGRDGKIGFCIYCDEVVNE